MYALNACIIESMKIRPPSNNVPTDSGFPRSAGALLEMVEQLQKQNQLLQGTLDEKAEIIDKKSDVIGAQKKRIAILEEHLRLAKHKQYGPNSEKNVLQGELFNEAELLADGDSDVSGEIEPETDATDEANQRGVKNAKAYQLICRVSKCSTYSPTKKKKAR